VPISTHAYSILPVASDFAADAAADFLQEVGDLAAVTGDLRDEMHSTFMSHMRCIVGCERALNRNRVAIRTIAMNNQAQGSTNTSIGCATNCYGTNLHTKR
jgi:hypothetical protein